MHGRRQNYISSTSLGDNGPRYLIMFILHQTNLQLVSSISNFKSNIDTLIGIIYFTRLSLRGQE